MDKVENMQEKIEMTKNSQATEAETQVAAEREVQIATEENDTPRVKKSKVWLVILSIIVVLLLAAAAGGYYWVAEQYQDRFLPNTTINGIVCDDMTVEEVTAILEAREVPYRLTVTGQEGEEIGVLTQKEIGLKIIGAGEGVAHIMELQDSRRWPLAHLNKEVYSHELVLETAYDEAMIVEAVHSWPALDEANMEEPKDAYITEYLPEKKGYEIVPETVGSLLDVEKATQEVLLAVEQELAELDLVEKDCYLQAEITAENKALNRRLRLLNKMVGAQITYDWNGTEVVLDAETIHTWLTEENGRVELDEEAVADFVSAQSKAYDTYGKNRKFTTALGETITVLNGGYGWRTDREKETAELLTLIKEGAVTRREPVYRYKAAQKGADDIGNSYVEIDLSNQHLYLYYKGSLVLETDFVSGNMSNGNTTPGGLYGLTYKTTNAVLRGADYVTPVHYWMPFNGNIGMHDATWRTEFGGDIFLTNGSHGCINLPLDKAAAIYPYLTAGFPIICYYY